MKLKDNIVRPIGAGLAMMFPLVLSQISGNITIATLGAMGAFSYLAFQYRSVTYNIKAITLHGLCLILSLFFGMISTLHPWSIPFIISLIAFLGKLSTKIYSIPKPDYFFVIMLYATGTNFYIHSLSEAAFLSHYLIYGLIGSLIAGLIISLFEGLPLKIKATNENKASFKTLYHQMIQREPDVILTAIHFSLILFITSYVSLLFKETNGYWILVSSAALLAADYTPRIKKRSYQRIIGSLVGLSIGVLIVSLNLSTPYILVLLIILNILIEIFMPINYTIANFFTNPQVLLLAILTTNNSDLTIVSQRLIGIIIGTVITYLLIVALEYALNTFNQNKLD